MHKTNKKLASWLIAAVAVALLSAAFAGKQTALLKMQKNETADALRKADKAYNQYMALKLERVGKKIVIPKGTPLQSVDGGKTMTFVLPRDY